MRPVRKADNLPPSCVVTKSGNRNFLEPSGTLRVCNGAALPLLLLGTVWPVFNFPCVNYCLQIEVQVNEFKLCFGPAPCCALCTVVFNSDTASQWNRLEVKYLRCLGFEVSSEN